MVKMCIVIKPADKGSGTVAMNRQNYLDECYRQLHDPSFYKRVNEDRAEDINKFLPQEVTG